MSKTRITILGATGYTALELIKILLRHPYADIVAVTSREDKRLISQVHHSLSGLLDLQLSNLSLEEVVLCSDCVFSCLPHTASAKVAPELLLRGVKVIDLSADYRLDSPDKFQHWYSEPHPDPDRLGNVVYGLPELFRKQIIDTNLIANPGCFPTSAILPLVPLVKSNIVESTDIIIDSKSGVSGGGRTAKLNYLYCECNENISAYNVGKHRHTPEIEQIISTSSGKQTTVIFTPHLTPMDRGILTTTYSIPKTTSLNKSDILDLFRRFYVDEPFIKIVDHLPGTKDVAGTNYVHITAEVVGNRVITISVIDNLIKGASGAAVQNFNLMFNYPETTALLTMP
ncbi:MAG: N-acetyl-gamma-glutamyl-phosphate reductase [Planctomycetaceae bacterium]|jgi:N-acetyl-gamma-glutamyl-phosphate reductase|nr:N-acetyl-gamma-glutamyl-phosphate reductase [Planctomycetaceae bacterium]